MELWYIFIIADVTSMLLASATAYLYFWLPNVQDSHGTCVFHFSLNIAVMHAIYLFYEITFEDIYFLGGYCIIGVHVFTYVVCAVNIWSVILSYNTWKEVKQMQQVNQMYPTRRLNRYRYLAYGIPALGVALSICARMMRRRSVFHSVYDTYECLYAITYSAVSPGPFVIILNVFYFVDSQRRLWNFFTNIVDAQNENSQSSSSAVALKYRILLNLKLCLTMNIPFCLSSIIHFVVFITSRYYFDPSRRIAIFLNFCVASLQGTLIFLAAVAFRRRAIKGFVRYGDNLCFGCVGVPECLRPSANNDVEETDDEAGRHPEEERGITLQSLRDEYGA